jgi:hypothetical protein
VSPKTVGVTLTAVVPVPKLTRVEPVKPEPLIVTVCPPDLGPALGEREEITGGGETNENARPTLVPPGVVAMTVIEPATREGVVTTTVVAVRETMTAALPPNVTLVVDARFVPVRVTDCPPVVYPDETLSDETVGAARYENALLNVAEP